MYENIYLVFPSISEDSDTDSVVIWKVGSHQVKTAVSTHAKNRYKTIGIITHNTEVNNTHIADRRWLC